MIKQTDEKLKIRTFHTIKVLLEVIVGLIMYAVISATTGKGIPCVFHLVTGKLCPGCGMTRALSSIIQGKFYEAISYNILSVTLCPLIGVFCMVKALKYIKTGQDEFTFIEILFLISCLIVCIIYFMIRNNII